MSKTFQFILSLLATACIVLAQESTKSSDDRVRQLEQAIGNHQPTEAEKARERKSRQRDLEEIKALGLPERALHEFNKRNPNASVHKWEANYFRTKAIVMMSIIYSDPSAKAAQQDVGFRKNKKEWEMIWQDPSILERR